MDQLVEALEGLNPVSQPAGPTLVVQLSSPRFGEAVQ